MSPPSVEATQSFIVRQECEQAAFSNGFRRVLGETQGWAAYASTTARGTIHLAAAGIHGPWFLALDHPGVIAELGLSGDPMPGPSNARYAFDTLGELHVTLSRVYALGVSLPDAPLQEFEKRVAALPRTTEAERLVVQRIGQDIFRARLMVYWQGRCPLTGISDPALLRASHIIPWAECESDAERLDVHNGLLLSALWDAAFDAGLLSFDDLGVALFNDSLSVAARDALGGCSLLHPPTAAQQAYLRVHRVRSNLADAQVKGVVTNRAAADALGVNVLPIVK
jgi:HNH endonuclease